MRRPRKNRNAALDAAELQALHELVDYIRAALGIDGSADLLSGVRELVLGARAAADEVERLRGDLERMKEALDRCKEERRALRDTGQELQGRNKLATALIDEANTLLMDFAAEAPPGLRVQASTLQGAHDLQAHLPLDPRQRITVQALINLRGWQARLSEFAVTGSVDRIPF